MLDVERSMLDVFQFSSAWFLCLFVVNLIPMSAEQQEPKERKNLDDRAKMT